MVNLFDDAAIALCIQHGEPGEDVIQLVIVTEDCQDDEYTVRMFNNVVDSLLQDFEDELLHLIALLHLVIAMPRLSARSGLIIIFVCGAPTVECPKDLSI